MKIKDIKCSCGNEDFFALKQNNTLVTGLYCSYCGKWVKWANKEEKRLIARNGSVFKGGDKND